MKSILSMAIGVVIAIMLVGCAKHTTSSMKFVQREVDMEAVLNEHIYFVNHNRVEPYHEDWKNVKCDFRQPSFPSDPCTATITAEVYEFSNATATEPVLRTNLELKLAYESNRWILKEVQEDSGVMIAGKWTLKGSLHPVTEKDTRWKVVIREMKLK